MAAAAIRSWPARAASTWRALGRMPAYQLPIVLGGALAVLAGAVAFAAAVVAERVLGVSWVRGLLLVAFGALALIGYQVTPGEPAERGGRRGDRGRGLARGGGRDGRFCDGPARLRGRDLGAPEVLLRTSPLSSFFLPSRRWTAAA